MAYRNYKKRRYKRRYTRGKMWSAGKGTHSAFRMRNRRVQRAMWC